nr:hypothetical protein [Tanacetum cinerariifolium]
MTSFGYRSNPRYAIKECSSCGTLYTRDCVFSIGNVKDKILVLKPPKNYARCTRYGYLVDDPNCQGCALLRQELEENMVTHSPDFQNTFESSNASTNIVNAPREPYVVKQDNGSFVDKIIFYLNKAPDSPHLHTISPNQFCCFHCKDVLRDGEAYGIFYKRCTCKSCGKDAHTGYNCPPTVSVIANPEPCNNQTIDELPQTLPSFHPTFHSESESPFTLDSTPTYVDESPNVTTSESSDDSTNVVNAPREPFVVKQDNGVKSSQNPPPIDKCRCECGNALDGIFCRQCICKSCGKGAHTGYNCPPKVPIISNPELCHQTINNELPQTLPSFDSVPCSNAQNGHYCTPKPQFNNPEQGYNQDFNVPQNIHNSQQQYFCCDQCGGPHETFQCQQCQPPQFTVDQPIFDAHNDFLKTQNELLTSQNKLNEQMMKLTSMCELACQIVQKKQEEKRIEEEQAANAPYWKIPACCDDDDDYDFAITPVLSTEDPIDSLSMGDEHLDTIPATESDEVIKSSVEDLVPIPSEFEDGNSFTYDAKSNLVDDSLNVFNPPLQPPTYSYEFYGNAANYGHDCSLHVPFTYDPEPPHNDVQNIHEELAVYINTLSWDRPTICYNDDDDEDCTIAITPNLSIEEPDNSLSIGDEHLDTISATKSDEFIKSSVENLVPIPSESEGIPDNMFDVPFHDNSPPLDISKDRFEDFSDSNDDSTLIDDDSFFIDNIEYVEASPLDSELISSKVMEIVIPEVGRINEDILLTIKDDILREKLLNINLLIAYIEALKDNPTPYSDFMTKFPSTSLNGSTTTRFDISLPDYEAFYNDHVKEISSGSTTTHSDSFLYDSFIFDLSINPFPPVDRSDFYHEEFVDEFAHIISPPEYNCFCFKNEPNSGDFTMDVVEDTFPTREPRVHMHNVLPTHPTLQLNLDFILSSESLFIMLYGSFFVFSHIQLLLNIFYPSRMKIPFLIPASLVIISLPSCLRLSIHESTRRMKNDSVKLEVKDIKEKDKIRAKIGQNQEQTGSVEKSKVKLDKVKA